VVVPPAGAEVRPLLRVDTEFKAIHSSKEFLVKLVLGPIVLGASVMVAMVGCGGNSSTPPSSPAAVAPSSVSAAPVAEAPSSAAATASTAAPSAAGSPADLPSLPAIFSSHSDPGLEGQLPAEVSGTTLQRYSISFSDALDAGGDRASIDAFLAGVDKTEADGSFAVAVDPTNTLGGGIFAFKVNGLDTASLLPAILSVEQSDLGAGATTKQATVGGKSVTVVSVGTGVNDTEWVYGRDDVVFVIHAADEAHAATFLQALS
jgi:hypothetical protein